MCDAMVDVIRNLMKFNGISMGFVYWQGLVYDVHYEGNCYIGGGRRRYGLHNFLPCGINNHTSPT